MEEGFQNSYVEEKRPCPNDYTSMQYPWTPNQDYMVVTKAEHELENSFVNYDVNKGRRVT